MAELHSHDGLSINWQSEGNGPPIVLVHGVGASLESWDEIASKLATDYRIVRADLRGHGRSGRIRTCNLPDFLMDIDALYGAAGLTDAHIVGFSLGGLIAQHFVLTRSKMVRSLTLFSTVADRTSDERNRILIRAEVIREEGIAAVTKQAQDRWFTPEYFQSHPETVARRLKELCANDPQSYEAAYRVFATADEGLNYRDITAPTLIATGEDDPNSNPRMARALHAGIKQSELKILPGLRHSILLEAPELIADMIRNFVAKQESALV